MGIIPNLQKTTFTILFGANLLVSIIANLINSIPPVIGAESSAKSESVTNGDPGIDPLSTSVFTNEVSDFLSPDVFSHANPFVYFLKKTQKLSDQTSTKIRSEVFKGLDGRQFPQQYIPYAKLVLSVLSCLHELRNIKEGTQIIHRFAEKDLHSTMPDIFTLDPVLSSLFSSYVFSDNYPPVRLLRKLQEIPTDDIPGLSNRVQKLLNHRYFPRSYSQFTKCLLSFLNNRFLLNNLEIDIDEIQRVTTSTIYNSNNLQIDDEVEVETEDLDSSAEPITKPDNSSISSQLSQKIVATVSNNDPDANTSLSKSINEYVRNFLSPDIFLQPDPFAYLLTKTTAMSRDTLRETNYYLTYSLDQYEFPPYYIQYAELLSSILSCLISLENTNKCINTIHRFEANRRSSSQQERISKFDPELSELFSDDIFSKVNHLSRILIALLDIPETEVSNVTTRLQNLLMTKYLPQRYQRYGNYLLVFLRNDYLLLRLKDNIAGIQRTLTSDLPTPDLPNSIIVQG